MSHRVNRFHWLGDHGRVDARKWRGLQRWAGEIPLACTAKDYVRIQHHPGTAEVWWLEQTAAFEEPDLVLPPSRFPGGEGARDSGPEATALREGP
jgi:tetraacyldisaccharide-1-P 4'-kinase